MTQTNKRTGIYQDSEQVRLRALAVEAALGEFRSHSTEDERQQYRWSTAHPTDSGMEVRIYLRGGEVKRYSCNESATTSGFVCSINGQVAPVERMGYALKAALRLLMPRTT